MMAYYSYFAYFVMLSTLFLALRYCIEGFLFRKALRNNFRHDDTVIIRAKVDEIKASESIAIQYFVKCYHKQSQLKLEEQIQLEFAPYLLSLASIKSVSPALGLCFTVISIMASFQIFSESGDIKAMFHAASIGLGTTAIGAMTIVISKLMMDRILIPLSLETHQRFHQQFTDLIHVHPFKNDTLKGKNDA